MQGLTDVLLAASLTLAILHPRMPRKIGWLMLLAGYGGFVISAVFGGDPHRLLIVFWAAVTALVFAIQPRLRAWAEQAKSRG